VTAHVPDGETVVGVPASVRPRATPAPHLSGDPA